MNHIISKETLKEVMDDGFESASVVFSGPSGEDRKQVVIRIRPFKNYIVYDVIKKTPAHCILVDRQFDKVEDAVDFYNKI